MKNMESAKAELEVQVDVERLDGETINEHLRSSTAVLHDILKDYVIEVDNMFACKHCGKFYKSTPALEQHSLMQHPPDNMEVECKMCHKKYPSIISLNKHDRYMHRYEHKCKVCYKSFATMELLINHGEYCSKSEAPCPDCGLIYDSQLALRNHVKYKHPQEKSNWCYVCRRAFISGRRLANHMSTIHPHGTVCTWCDKEFNSVMALQSHVLYRHTKNVSRCVECRKVFMSESNLSRHVLKNHASVSKQ